eukprot:TRINITY_DN1341_c1_g1_i2.p1 TRINITY_DN1341_c1_g1~~TRINITY_DN1341_c1_g1_i2.p1  ORF type:complete len:292 (-),score=29.20 TRINITY_DN1341_c1_g1_i2:222-1037(-)
MEDIQNIEIDRSLPPRLWVKRNKQKQQNIDTNIDQNSYQNKNNTQADDIGQTDAEDQKQGEPVFSDSDEEYPHIHDYKLQDSLLLVKPNKRLNVGITRKPRIGSQFQIELPPFQSLPKDNFQREQEKIQEIQASPSSQPCPNLQIASSKVCQNNNNYYCSNNRTLNWQQSHLTDNLKKDNNQQLLEEEPIFLQSREKNFIKVEAHQSVDRLRLQKDLDKNIIDCDKIYTNSDSKNLFGSPQKRSQEEDLKNIQDSDLSAVPPKKVKIVQKI